MQAAVPHVHDAALLSVRRAAGVLNYTASVTRAGRRQDALAIVTNLSDDALVGWARKAWL